MTTLAHTAAAVTGGIWLLEDAPGRRHFSRLND